MDKHAYWEGYVELCHARGVDPQAVVKQAGWWDQLSGAVGRGMEGVGEAVPGLLGKAKSMLGYGGGGPHNALPQEGPSKKPMWEDIYPEGRPKAAPQQGADQYSKAMQKIYEKNQRYPGMAQPRSSGASYSERMQDLYEKHNKYPGMARPRRRK